MVLVFCRNVEPALAEALGTITDPQLERIDRLLLLDNASQDRTPQVAARLASDPRWRGKLCLDRSERDLGLGGSFKKGYRIAAEAGFSHILTLHGDAQGDSRQILDRFLATLDARPSVDAVFASRFFPGADRAGYAWTRRAGNAFFDAATRILTGLKMSDPGTGIYLMKVSAISGVPLDRLTDSFQFHPQLNILLHEREDLERETVPMSWKDSRASSNVSVVRYGLRLLLILLRYSYGRRLRGRACIDAVATEW
jgi:glycosyltransferase involved in cell wall biosynthesis